MAHFTRVRASGFWTSGSTLLNTEMEAIDSRLYKAVNGDDGGAWAPSSTAITIGGLGVSVTGPFVSSGTFNVNSLANLNAGAVITGANLSVSLNATVQGNLEVQSTTHLIGNVTADGDIAAERIAIHGAHLGSNILSVDGDGRLTGDLTVDGAGSVGGAFGVVGTLSAIGGIAIAGASTLTKAVTTSSEGRVRRRYTALTDADTTIHANNCDIAQMRGAVMTADRNIAVTTTGAAAGDTMLIVNDDFSHSLYVRDGSYVGSVFAQLKNASSFSRAVMLVFDGTTWRTLYPVAA